MRHHKDRISGIGGQLHQRAESGSVKEQNAVFGDPTDADDETMGPPIVPMPANDANEPLPLLALLQNAAPK
jgi:hypothetical protein